MASLLEVHDKLHALRQQTLRQRSRLSRIDLASLQKLDGDQQKQFQKLEKALRGQYRKAGKATAKRHLRSLQRSRRINASHIDQALHSGATLPVTAVQRFFCRCQYPHAAEEEGHDQETELSPGYGEGPSAAVSFSSSENKAQLFAGADTSADVVAASATAKAWFRFSFTPPADGTYCVRPVVQMNGYWMLWAGAAVECTEYASLPIFGFRVSVRLVMEQLSDPVFNTSWDILTGPSSASFSAGFDFDSVVDDDLSVEVDLVGGDQTVVFVECVAEVYANNGMHSRVDMQSSPFFYFSVRELRWGTPCFSRFVSPVGGAGG